MAAPRTRGLSLAVVVVLLALLAPPAAGRRKKPRRKQAHDAAAEEGGTMYGFDPMSTPMVEWVGSDLQPEPRRRNVTCAVEAREDPAGCYPTTCGRAVIDGFFSEAEVKGLLEIVEHGMARAGSPTSEVGGPTIMDLNTGMLRDAGGVKLLYPEPGQPGYDPDAPPPFDKGQLDLYRDAMARIRKRVAEEFGLSRLYFTAPTFVTRLVGNPEWKPAEIHDQYWHPHVDKQNTAHYDYSGLVYLSEYGEDFTGGELAFLDTDEATGSVVANVVHPRAGRLATFTSGDENLHHARKVETGVRFVMSMWFTCDPDKEFVSFLDGKVHNTFTSGATSGEL
jgi:hypothetical protein|eukprot:COSAG06_NODE_81_length_25302_cov_21.168902_9_plen_336_part_00